jgi:hypothetical protein
MVPVLADRLTYDRRDNHYFKAFSNLFRLRKLTREIIKKKLSRELRTLCSKLELETSELVVTFNTRET